MLYYKNNKWNMCNEKVKYIQHNKEVEQYVRSESKDWWINFGNKWEHTKIVEFIPIIYEPTQLERFNDIEYMEESLGDIYSDYVERGIVLKEVDLIPNNHPIKTLLLSKENKKLGQSLTDIELESISQGQLYTEIDIRLSRLEGK